MKQLFYALLFTLPSVLSAQDSGFIHGTITTIDGKSYKGPIRWGKEEVFWTDHFNSAKEENDNLQYLSREQREALDDRYHGNNGRLMHWVTNKAFSYHHDSGYNHAHQFVCQFGEIQSMTPIARNKVKLVLRDGRQVDISGEGYNDIGGDIKIIDPELGEMNIDWARIEKVEFSEQNKIDKPFGKPLFGKVETHSGTFTGYIQWDHDERVSTDKLDGSADEGKLSVEFANIRSIENRGNSSQVILKSGREVTLRGTNDVNDENRGIVVMTKTMGRIDIPWQEFRKVQFADHAGFDLKSYSEFKKQRQLEGSVVTTDGKVIKGRIVYDLDEEFDYEMLQGKDDNVEYFIPFGDIKRIMPKNYDYSNIELKNGEKLLLGEGQDVSDRNTGMLVFSGSEPTYITWEKIKEVNFN